MGFDAPDFRTDANYDERLATLKRQLAEPVAPIGQFHNVPALPPHFLNRSEALDTLRELVIADVDKPTLISAEKRTTAVEGMGGLGKSVLAAAFAHDRKVRFAFPDGIVWLTAGRDAKLFDLYRAVGVDIGDDLRNYPDETTARQNAQKALAGKKCLLILDDVWELPVGRAFRDLISSTVTRLLITTRNLQINNQLNVNEYRLKLIDESQAADYLRSWVDDDPNLDEIAERLGYLFLALSLAGRLMYENSLTGAEYLSMFERVSDMEISPDREDSLEISINLGVDAAFANHGDRKLLYHTFGIFQEDAAVPQQTILQLWSHLRSDIRPIDHLKTLTTLVNLGLVERDEQRTITLHDLLHNYAHEKLGDRYVQTHQDLLNSYSVEAWHELPPDEPYLWWRIAYHLIEAGRIEDIHHLLTDSPDWMQAKFDACNGYEAVDQDISLLLETGGFVDPLPEEKSTALFQLHAVRMSLGTEAESYSDNDLEVLVWLSHIRQDASKYIAEAISHAHLRQNPEDQISALKAIFWALWHTNQGEQYLELVDELPGIAARIYSSESRSAAYGEIIRILTVLDQINEAKALLPHIEDPYYLAGAFCDIALRSGHNNSAYWDEALNTARSITNDYRRLGTLAMVCNSQTKAGIQHNWAEIVNDEYFAGNAVLIEFVCKLLSVASTEILPGSLWQRLADVAVALEEPVVRINSLLAIQKVLPEYLQDQASKVIAASVPEIKKDYLRTRAQSSILRANVETTSQGDWMRLIDQVRRTQADRNITSLDYIVGDLVAVGNVGTALELSKEIESEVPQGRSLEPIVESLAKDAQWDKAMEIAMLIPPNQRYKALRVIVEKQLEQGLDTGLWEQARTQKHSYIADLRQKLAIRGLVEALANSGKWQIADRLARLTEDSWEQKILNTIIAEAMAGSGNWKEALAKIEEIKDINQREITKITVVENLSRSGMVKDAIDLAQSIEDEAVRVFALLAIARITKMASNNPVWNEIDEIVSKTEGDFNRCEILTELIETYVELGNKQKAITYASELEPCIEYDTSLLALGRVLELNSVPSVKEKLMSLAVRIDNAYFRVMRFLDIAKAYPDDAPKILQLGLELVPAIGEDIFDDELSNALVEIVDTYAFLGMYEEAIKVAQRIEINFARKVVELDSHERVDAYRAIAKHRLANTGEIAVSLGLLPAMNVDCFIQDVAEMQNTLSAISENFWTDVITEIIRIASWTNPLWLQVYQILTESNDPTN